LSEDGACAAYYLTALGAVVAGLRARSNIGRAAPLLALFAIRVACLGVRIALNAGSHAAVVHYAIAEVCCFRSTSAAASMILGAQCKAGAPAKMALLLPACGHQAARTAALHAGGGER
jgi:hypothetical protein